MDKLKAPGRPFDISKQVHPDITRIVYCQDARRRGWREHTSFTFVGRDSGRRVRTRSDDHDRLRTTNQQGRPEQDQLAGAVLAAAHPDRSLRSGPRAADQPHRAAR